MVLGSLGAFLVLEAREHAEGRGAPPLARLVATAAGRNGNSPGQAAGAAWDLWRLLAEFAAGNALAVVSGASGAEPATAEERIFLQRLAAGGPRPAVRGISGVLGHGLDAQFPASVALAALALARGRFYPPFEDSGFEEPLASPFDRVLVTSFGHWRGHGLALLAGADSTLACQRSA